MARTNKPWYWEARKGWYVKINGVRHKLGPSKAEAQKAFHKLMAAPPSSPVKSDSVAAILDDFLGWTFENRELKTYQGYKDFCESFCKLYPRLQFGDLTTAEVNEWLKRQTTWNSTTKRGAITAIQRGFNWAMKNRGLTSNPIAGMEKPKARRRTVVMTPEDFKAILDNVPDQFFRDLLVISYDCGARPQEVKALEAKHIEIEKQRAVLKTEEAKGKRRPRAIYFPTERSMEIIQRLCEEHPKGNIFRNRLGNAWTGYAVKCRFANLEKKVGKRFRQYDFRHTFITEKLLAGVDSHVVATLAGHSDSSMIDRVYSHVAEDHKFMLDAAKKTIRDSDD